jgi:cysteine desulfurase
MIYLDHNATTPPTPRARAAADEAMRDGEGGLWANPSSVHRAGQAVRHRIELARESLAGLLRVEPKQLTFTSGGTESIALAVRGTIDAACLARAPRAGESPIVPAKLPIIVSSKVEHAAVRDLLDELAKTARAEVRWAPVDTNGIVRVGSLDPLLEHATLAVFQWANNETGVVQPIDAIGLACRRRAAKFLCDATQWIGKEPVPYDARDPRHADGPPPPYDLLACSAHKFHGPKGVGVLWTGPGARYRPQVPGSQELGRRGGTENVPGILGAGAAGEDAVEWLGDPAHRARQAERRDRFERRVLAACAGACVNAQEAGPGAAAPPRLWNTTNIAFPRLEAEALLLLLSERGLAASAGAACSSGSLDPSPVLLAMGVPETLAHGSLRFSLGRDTGDAEVEQAISIVAECVARLTGSSAAMFDPERR